MTARGMVAVWLVLAATAAGCQLTRDLTNVELQHAQCMPGEQVQCTCEDGRRGRQICHDAGTFEACRCGGTSTDGGDADSDTGTDSIGAKSCGGCSSGVCSGERCRDKVTLTVDQFPGEGGRNPRLGYALTTTGETIVAGAPYRDLDGVQDAGALHIFERQSNGSWADVAMRTASDPIEDGGFASEVAASDSTIFTTVRSRKEGGAAIVVYERNDGDWKRVQTIEPTAAARGARFGKFLGVTPDGQLLVGSPPPLGDEGTNVGRVEFFGREGDEWKKRATVIPPGDLTTDSRFGYEAVVISDALFVSADLTSVDGQDSVGTVIRYRKRDGEWRNVERLVPTETREKMWFGHRLDRSAGTLVVAAPHDSETVDSGGAVFVFAPEDGSWKQRQKISEPKGRTEARFGHDIVADEDRLLIGMLGQRDVELYGRQGERWEYLETITAEEAAPGNWFGFRLGMLPGPLGISTEPRRSGGGVIHIYNID